MTQVQAKLHAVKSTLEKVSASGADNWDRLLACVRVIGEVIEEMQKEEDHADDHAE